MLSRFLSVLALLMSPLVCLPVFADPPGRVGRLSLVAGNVSFRDLTSGEVSTAILNWPVTSQNTIVTDPGARAEVRVGSTALRIDGSSELEFVQLDDQHIKLHLNYGSAAVRLRSRDAAQDFELATPHGRVLLLEPGRYRIDAERAPGSTAVSAFQGSARIDATNDSVTLRGGERAEIWDGYPRVQGATRDAFDDWSLARDRRDEAARSARYVSPEMTGYEDLDDYGHWHETVEYGPVWYPRAVASGWVPYRWGHWAWVTPWGWTWVDDAPWGFAPFHYGRWVTIRGAWGWVPGRIVPRPVYAPALVAWVGRPGWNVSVNTGSAPAVGWFPLAPREVFYPGYRCSPAYVRNVNVTHVTNVTQISNVTQQNVAMANANYVNRHVAHAVTVVPAEAVASGRPIRHAILPMTDRRMIADLPVVHAPSAIAPALAAPRPFARGAALPRVPRAGDNPAAAPPQPLAVPAASGTPAQNGPGRPLATPQVTTPPPAAVAPGMVQRPQIGTVPPVAPAFQPHGDPAAPSQAATERILRPGRDPRAPAAQTPPPALPAAAQPVMPKTSTVGPGLQTPAATERNPAPNVVVPSPPATATDPPQSRRPLFGAPAQPAAPIAPAPAVAPPVTASPSPQPVQAPRTERRAPAVVQPEAHPPQWPQPPRDDERGRRAGVGGDARMEPNPVLERQTPREAIPIQRREEMRSPGRTWRGEQPREQRPAAQPEQQPGRPMAQPSPRPIEVERRPRIEPRPEARSEPRPQPRIESPAPPAEGGHAPRERTRETRRNAEVEAQKAGPGARMQ